MNKHVDGQFGWAILGKSGFMLPARSTRVETIRGFIHSMDADVPKSFGPWLLKVEADSWRRCKYRYGVRCVRVRVTLAFAGEA